MDIQKTFQELQKGKTFLFLVHCSCVNVPLYKAAFGSFIESSPVSVHDFKYTFIIHYYSLHQVFFYFYMENKDSCCVFFPSSVALSVAV